MHRLPHIVRDVVGPGMARNSGPRDRSIALVFLIGKKRGIERMLVRAASY